MRRLEEKKGVRWEFKEKIGGKMGISLSGAGVGMSEWKSFFCSILNRKVFLPTRRFVFCVFMDLPDIEVYSI